MTTSFQGGPRTDDFIFASDNRFTCSGAWRGLDIEEDIEQAGNFDQSREGEPRRCMIQGSEGRPYQSESSSLNNGIMKHSRGVSEQRWYALGDEDTGYFEKLPEHLLIEILVRVATSDWIAAACVKRGWAAIFRGDGLWQTALNRRWPGAGSLKRWPGPIGRGSTKRYVAELIYQQYLLDSKN